MAYPFIIIGDELLSNDTSPLFENSRSILDPIHAYSKQNSKVFLGYTTNKEIAEKFVDRLKQAGYENLITDVIDIDNGHVDIKNDSGIRLSDAFMQNFSKEYSLDPKFGIYVDIEEETQKAKRDNGIDIVTIKEKADEASELDYKQGEKDMKAAYHNIWMS